jgi:hypothetical protein
LQWNIEKDKQIKEKHLARKQEKKNKGLKSKQNPTFKSAEHTMVRGVGGGGGEP